MLGGPGPLYEFDVEGIRGEGLCGLRLLWTVHVPSSAPSRCGQVTKIVPEPRELHAGEAYQALHCAPAAFQHEAHSAATPVRAESRRRRKAV